MHRPCKYLVQNPQEPHPTPYKSIAYMYLSDQFYTTRGWVVGWEGYTNKLTLLGGGGGQKIIIIY